MKGVHRAGLRRWREILVDADDSPYVGPRPQTSVRDKGMLIGRDADLERIETAVIHRSLLVLDGNSGVGKSSLLQNGLYGLLEQSGFGVLVNRQWKATGEPLDSEAAIDRYLARGILGTHDALGYPVPAGLDVLAAGAGPGLCAFLEDCYGDTAAVLILDQFEELLRQHGARAEQVVRWVIDAGFRSSIRVILSLRTDSLHRLDPLIRGIKPFSMDRVRLAELDDEGNIQTVIRTPRSTEDAAGATAAAPESRIAIANPAVDRLMEMWRAHQPKLLDLQATLYALYFRAKLRARRESGSGSDAVLPHTVIELDDVNELTAESAGTRRDGDEPNVFAVGLREAIRLKIAHAAEASQAAGLDPYLLSGTLEAVKRIAPLLSSSDFKVPIHEVELAQRTLYRELRVLEQSLIDEHELLIGKQAQPRRMIRNRVVEGLHQALLDSGDFLSAHPDQVKLLVGLHERIGAREQPPGRWNAPAGPMLYRAALETLFEELRRVAFAVEWLETTEIARKDSDGILLLIHDRSGEALKAWADEQKDEPSGALRLLTGARGEHFVWTDAGEGIGNLDPGAGHHEVIANLNWRDCRITTHFRRIVFVNCDFTGSRFDGCTFEGVTFLNCILNEATFEFCEIRGENDQRRIERLAPTTQQKGGKLRLAPSFTVQARAGEVATFGLYLGADGQECSSFFSDTSGVPAVPGGRPANHAGEMLAHFVTDGRGPRRGDSPPRPDGCDVVTPTKGGVAMVGGRLHFLTVHRCRARDGGSFSFHHVSGGGLDIVEQQEGRIDIHDCVLRGISATRDRDHAETEGNAAGFDVAVHESFVFNVYFSEELAGSAKFQNSIVLMLLNASDASRFPVRLQNCRYQCLVNTDDPQGREDSRDLREPEDPPYFAQQPRYHSRFTLPNRELLASDLEAMDFRSRPEVREARQRSGSAPQQPGRTPAATALRVAGGSSDAVGPSTIEQES